MAPTPEKRNAIATRDFARTASPKARTPKTDGIASKIMVPLTLEHKQKVDLKSGDTITGGKVVQNRILQWQTLSASPAEESLENQPSAKHKLSKQKSSPEKIGSGTDRGLQEIEVNRSRSPALTPRKTSKDPDIQAATTPRKRVVSDEHWRLNRTPKDISKSAPRPNKSSNAQLWKGQDGVEYSAWVRKRPNPEKVAAAAVPAPPAVPLAVRAAEKMSGFACQGLVFHRTLAW